MNLRYFIYTSLAIHILAGFALLIYYKPFKKDPVPVQKIIEEVQDEVLEEATSSEKVSLKKKSSKRNLKKDLKKEEVKKDNKKVFARKEIVKKVKTKTKKEKVTASQDVGKLMKDVPANLKFKSFSDLKIKAGNPSLKYPALARRNKGQGLVSVIYFVTKDGLVDKIQLESSSGHRELDNYVLRLLARYKFKPNQSSWVRHKVEFILEGEEEEILKLRSF